MKDYLSFFKKRSVQYFIFACLFYLLFLVVGFKVADYVSPENSKSLESIVPIVGVIFTGIISFIYEREKARGAKIYEKKIEVSDKFLETLNQIIKDNQVDVPSITTKNGMLEEKDELKDLLFMLATLRIYFNKDLINLISYYCNCILEELYEFKFGEEKAKFLNYQKISEFLFSISIALKQELDILMDESGDFYNDNPESKNIEKTIKAHKDLSNLNKLIETIKGFSETNPEPIEANGNRKPWHVNVGEEPGVKLENQYRCWEDMKNINFWSAGGAKRYADGVHKLKKEDIIYAYVSKKGYVAKGTVKSEPKLIGEFFEQNKIKEKLKTVSLKSELFKTHLEDKSFEGFYNKEIGEYAVEIDWELTKDVSPFYSPDFKISPLTICLMNSKNLEILEKVNWVKSE